MNTEAFTYLLDNPEQLDTAQHKDIEDIIKAFPYFQAARALQLKALKDAGSFKYNTALKTTAACTADRAVLFEFITSKHFTQHNIAKHIQNREAHINQIELVDPQEVPAQKPQELEQKLKSELQKAKAILDPDLFTKKSNKTAEEAPVQIQDEPLEFKAQDTHSFDVWLSLTKVNPIERSSPDLPDFKAKKKEARFKLIDKFLQEQPKIDPTEAQSSGKNLAKAFSKPADSLMTETLAKVYTQQKNYKKAIQAYKILSLKNSEKSGFFADQIRAIEKLIAQNKAEDNDNV